jgi:SAM-dependent methyltransferase
VIAVEPLAEMRAMLQRVVPEAEALDGTAESLPLADASVDAVTAAQAFHWFVVERTLPELHRVLRPEGSVALVWNTRDIDDPLQARVEELIEPYRNAAPVQARREWREDIDSSPLFGPIEQHSFPWAQAFTRDTLAERVATTSVVAGLPVAERDALLERVRDAARDLDEPFPFRYVTEIFLITRTSHPNEG